jgi:hypothetical protein
MISSLHVSTQPILLLFLYLIIGVYALVALYLIPQGILDSRKRECDRGSSIRALESRTISDRVEALRKYGWRNTWLPGRIGINAPPARRPTRELLIRVLTHRQ